MPEKSFSLLPHTIGLAAQYLKLRGVQGFSLERHFKVIDGNITAIPCIRFYVARKYPKWLCWILRRLIPEIINGVQTDVWAIGTQRPQQDEHKTRHETLVGGIGFCHYKCSSATLGIILNDKTTMKPKEVSNCHVIYNVDNPGGDCSQIGDPQLQPAPLEGGTDPKDRAGYGERYIPLSGALPGGIGDAACAEVKDCRAAKVAEILHLGKIKGVAEPEVGMRVRVCCRNGDFEATIYERAALVQVQGYGCHGENKYALFQKQVMYQPGFGPGSSGAVAISDDNYAVALNAFGSGGPGTGNGGGAWFSEIMDPLNLTFEEGPAPPPPPEAEFEYSLDEGKTWERAKLMYIRGVIAKPTEATIKVKVDGIDVGEGQKVEGQVVEA